MPSGLVVGCADRGTENCPPVLAWIVGCAHEGDKGLCSRA